MIGRFAVITCMPSTQRSPRQLMPAEIMAEVPGSRPCLPRPKKWGRHPHLDGGRLRLRATGRGLGPFHLQPSFKKTRDVIRHEIEYLFTFFFVPKRRIAADAGGIELSRIIEHQILHPIEQHA